MKPCDLPELARQIPNYPRVTGEPEVTRLRFSVSCLPTTIACDDCRLWIRHGQGEAKPEHQREQAFHSWAEMHDTVYL
jgi:hypothetical protein